MVVGVSWTSPDTWTGLKKWTQYADLAWEYDLSKSLETLKRIKSAILFCLQRNSNRLRDGVSIAIDFHTAIWKILEALPPGSSFYQAQIDVLPNDPSKRDVVELAMNLLSRNFPTDESGFSDTIPISRNDLIKPLNISLQDWDSFSPGKIIIPSESILEKEENGKLLRDIKNEIQTMLSTWILYLTTLHRRDEVERFDFAARFDSLTELPNRRSLFAETLEGNDIYYLMIDIDHFKNINDTYGHPIWDIVLREFAFRLQEICLANNARAYRFGGEEFTVAGLWNKEDARIISQSILEAIQWMEIEINNDWKNETIRLTISIGGMTNSINSEWKKQ